MEATGSYWKPVVRHEALGIEWRWRTPPPVGRSWPVKLGAVSAATRSWTQTAKFLNAGGQQNW